MPFTPINLDGQFGMVRDVPGHLLQPNAWTSVQNARMDNTLAGSILGHAERFASPPIDVYSVWYLPGESNLFWVMAGLNDIYAHSGSTYTEITRTLKVPFDTGSEEPTQGDVLEGITSGATGTVFAVTVDSGTFGTSDAAGTIELEDVTGTFGAAENLKNNTTTTSPVATTTGESTEGDYSTGGSDRWTGGVLSGILVLNNGSDDPQYWANAETNTRLANLPNWPSDTKAKIIRPFKNFLVALDVTTGGTRFPYLVKWSHSASAGAVPSSWDETDATKDAGQFDLGETKDVLVDCLPLGADLNIVYKEQTTWGMQFIGHPFIFRFYNIFGNQGLFAPQCAVEYKSGQHAALTRGDFIVHNGQTFESVIDGRNRQWLFGAIDPDNWERVFVTHNAKFSEVWICFPTLGSAFCDSALIWNYRENTWARRELPQISDMKPGIINPAVNDTWDDGPADTWDGGLNIPWDSTEADPTRFNLLMASPVAGSSKVYEVDVSDSFDGASFLSYMEREGLSVEPLRRDGSITSNTESWKCLRGIRPRFRSPPTGGTVEVWIGVQEHINADVLWHGPYETDIENDYKVDFIHSARLFGVRFQSRGAFEIDGYDLDISLTSLY